MQELLVQKSIFFWFSAEIFASRQDWLWLTIDVKVKQKVFNLKKKYLEWPWCFMLMKKKIKRWWRGTKRALIFDESGDLNCDTVPLPIHRAVSTLINLVKVIAATPPSPPVLVSYHGNVSYAIWSRCWQLLDSIHKRLIPKYEKKLYHFEMEWGADLIYWLMITLSPLR